MREKIGKKGHRRQISKQLIKRKLMEDLYPIPRQRDSGSRLKMKSALNIKFMNTLQFLEFNRIETLMLHKFEEKLTQELIISPNLLDTAFQYLKVDTSVYRAIKKLVNLHTKPEQNKDNEQFMHMLKNIIPTSKASLQSMVALLLFYHFVSLNINQYRAIIKEFQKQRIFELINSINYPKSQLITSKILSIVFIILLKYNETERIIKIGFKVINLRRMIQGSQKRSINDHKRETLFFNLKYIEALMKSKSNPFQLMAYLHKQLEILEKQEKNDFNDKETIKIYKNQLFKLKKNIQSQVENDYYQNYKSEEKILQPQKNKDKINSAIKQLKRRKSVNMFKRSISFDSKQSQPSVSQDKPAKDVDKKFKEIYNPPKNIQQFSKITSGNLKKGRKITKSTLFQQASKTPSVIVQHSKEQNNKISQHKHKSRSKQVQADQTLFAKLTGLYQIAKRNNFCKQQQPSNNQIQEKKKKIKTIYQNFHNLNKIVRQIPRKNLQRQFYDIREFESSKKNEIKQMVTTQIINFSAGLQNGSYEISYILNNKGCLQLQFIKVWLGIFYLISIVIEAEQQEFILRVTLNQQIYNIVLNRGNNLLCERYVTIWPTIRYLVNKKLYRYSIFKKYQHLLLAKKMPQLNLIQLQSEIYLQKFGFISKQEIQQINICLDSVFKIILISRHYYGNSFHSNVVKINEQMRLPCLIPYERQQGEIMKLNLLSEIYLSTNTSIVLVQFIYTNSDKYFFVRIETSRQKLVNIIKNRQEVEISIVTSHIQSNRTQIQTKIQIQWIQLELNLIIFQDFKKYAVDIFTRQPKDKHFGKKLISFFSKRLVLKYHPIFLWQCKFSKELNLMHQQKRQIYDQLQFDQNFQRHRLETIESYCESQMVPISENQINSPFQKMNQSRKQNLANTSKGCKITKAKPLFTSKKKNIHLDKVQIWKQQKRISEKDYLIIINISEQRISQEWIAQFTVINRKSEAKYILALNHLDLFHIYQDQLSIMHEESHLDKQDQESNIKSQIRHQKKILLSKLINSTSFYYSNYQSKICIEKDGNYYRYNFYKQIKLEKQLANRRQNKNKNALSIYPLLQRFTLYCHLRIVKPIKINSKFAFLIFKQNFIQDQYFWEIVVEFPRKQTHFVCHLKDQDIICYISDYRKKKHKKQETPKKLESSFSIPPLSRFCLSLSLSFQSSKREQSVNYKNRILNLVSMNHIQVIHKDNKYKLVIFQDEYILRQRIIHQYDSTTLSLYNVWVNHNTVQIQHFQKDNSIENSHSRESSFLSTFKRQVIGQIQLSLANRFYELENKEFCNINDFHRKNKRSVCQFYFDFVKQQKYKQNKFHQAKSSISLQQNNQQ